VRTSHDDVRTTRALFRATSIVAAFAIVRHAARVPPIVLLPGRAGALTFGVDTSLLLVGVGGLMSSVTGWSTLVGGLVTYGIAAPALGLEPAYRSIVQFMVWPTAALL